MIVIGLTGSIAMGKTTIARLFAEEGVPVFDADVEVHRLYAKGGAAVERIASIAPEAIIDMGVDRSVLSRMIRKDQTLLPKIEALVHPLVSEARDAFLQRAMEQGRQAALLDIPLLFETGRESLVDVIVVVSAPLAVQRARALSREGMTKEKFEAILARQMPDTDKRARADFVIDTNKGLDAARGRVQDICAELIDGASDA